MNTDREQRVKPADGPYHPRLPGTDLDILDVEWADGDCGIIYDPAGDGDTWISANQGHVFEIGVDRRGD